MRKKNGIIAGLWLMGAVLAGSGCLEGLLFSGEEKSAYAVQAASSQDIPKETGSVNREKEKALTEKKQLEKDIAELKKQKGDVLENIEFLDGKMTELSAKIEKNKKDISEAEKESKRLRSKKKKVKKERKKQYDIMSKRIKYIYENGSSGYLELLLRADSLSELFSRAEYVSQVTDYDNNLLLAYQEVCAKLEKAQDKLEQNLRELEGLKENLKVEEESEQLLFDKKSEELGNYKDLIQKKNGETRGQEDLLKAQDEELERLLGEQRKKAGQEARKKAEREAGKGYRWPLSVKGSITSRFGSQNSPAEGAGSGPKGIDISVPVGTPVLAASAGTVITAAYSVSAGNYIVLYHGDGIYSYYMHCSSLSVGVGQTVPARQQVALSGNTGISTGPHLHFAIYAHGAYVNPLNYVS